MLKNILFADDDANIVEIYRESLEREGFEVPIAGDGLAAMRSLHHTKPDLVILDLMMPKFDGVDVLKFIRANPDLKHTKVVIFSNATPTANIAIDAEKIGADAFLFKLTCTPEKLINVVKPLLCDDPASEEQLKL
jgi:DNA-binding response OmpR family regulator